MFQFGSGILFANPSTTVGNSPTNPTPYQVNTLQDVSVDFSIDLKELRGQNQFPDDVAPGDKKISGKFSFGRIDIGLFNNIFMGETMSTGIKQIQPREAGTIGATPYQITVTNSATFSTDLGVIFALTGIPLIRVTSGPVTGQYSVSAGVYTFAAADTGLGVSISYVWTSNATTSRTLSITNRIMGFGPIFELWLADSYQQSSTGLNNGVHLYACRAGKVTWDQKRDGYLIPSIEYQSYANASGAVGELFQTVG